MTVEDYLLFEERSSVRHEFVDGRVFAMSGVRKRHNIIAGNIFATLRSHVRGSRCRAYMSDVKARVEATNSFYYPDVMVSCEAYDKDSIFTNCPVLIVEVLSRSTAAIDRREKLFAYKQLNSLREYLIVHQTKQRVELHCRTKDGSWDILEFGPGQEIMLEAIPVGPLRMSMDAIYEDVEWQKAELTVKEESPAGYLEEGELDW